MLEFEKLELSVNIQQFDLNPHLEYKGKHNYQSNILG